MAGCGFLPVTDVKKARELVESLGAKVEAGQQGVFKVTGKGGRKSVYVKELPGGWLFVAEKPDVLAHLPTIDPLALLGGLEKQYDAAVRLDLSNVPAAWRQPLLSKIRAGIARESSRRWFESEQDFAIRQKVLAFVEAALTGAVEDLDQATLAWSLDAAGGKVRVDFSVAAREGTPTAQRFAELPGGGSQFAAFRLPGAALSANWTTKIPAPKIDLLTAIADVVRDRALADIDRNDQHKPAEEVRDARKLVGEAADLLEKTIRSGHCDGGLAVLSDANSLTAVAGAYVADGAQLDKSLRFLVQRVTEKNAAVGERFHLDAARVKDVRVHTVSIPIAADAKLVALIGEPLEAAIGVGPQSVYLAVGREPLAAMRRVIESAQAGGSPSAPLVQVSLDVRRVAELVAAVGKPRDRPKAARVAAELKRLQGGDHVDLAVEPIAHGVRWRLEVEPAVVKLVVRQALTANLDSDE